MFMPSETAMISAFVLDFEFSFCTLDVVIKYPLPRVTHIPDVDFM